MKKNKKPETTVKLTNGLGDLGVALESTKIKLAVPTLDLNSLKTIGSGADAREAKKAGVKKIQQEVAAGLKYRLDANREIAACQDSMDKRITEEEYEAPLAEVNTYLSGVLELHGILQTAAAVAYLETVLTTEYQTPDEVNSMLHDLIARKLLVSNGEGQTVKIGYNWYHIGDFGLKDDDVTKVQSAVNQYDSKVKTMEKIHRQKLSAELAKEATININEALNGGIGKCFLHTPAEAVMKMQPVTEEGKPVTEEGKPVTALQPVMKNGKPLWRGGGDVLWDFKSKTVAPIRASGSIEKLIGDIQVQGVEITRHALTWESPSNWQSLARSSYIERDLRLHGQEADNYAQDFLTLWHILSRGVRHYDAMVEQAEALEAMKAKAEISACEFFGLNGNGGTPVTEKTALLQFNSVLNMANANLYSPFILARKVVDDGGKTWVEVMEVPEHLSSVYGPYVGKLSESNDGELGRLLGFIRGQTEMAVATSSATEKAPDASAAA